MVAPPKSTTLMARQPMLFGTFVSKESFFKNLEQRGDGDGYYDVVEVLWYLDNSCRNKKEFFVDCQRLRKEKYSVDVNERRALLQRTEAVVCCMWSSVCYMLLNVEVVNWFNMQLLR